MAELPWQAPAALTDLGGIAELDHDRAGRRGYPEAVYCEPKTADQVRAIAGAVRERGTPTLFTRCAPEHVEAIRAELPDARHDEVARLVTWPPTPPEPTGGLVVVAAAGTSDLPVAREALLVAAHLGRRAELVLDVGVAGLHRVLGAGPAAQRRRGRRGGRYGRCPAHRGRRARAARRSSPCPPRWATARRSRGWPPCWPCSTPAPPGWPWSTSTTGSAPACAAHRINHPEPAP